MRATAAQHIKARDLSQEAFIAVFGLVPSLGERQYLQAVGCLESTYGGGWKGAGVGYNNIGAIQGGRPPCDPATEFETGDTHEDGTGYRWCYKKYPTLLDGWIDLVRTLYVKGGGYDRSGVRLLAANNEFMKAVEEQRRTHYFEAPLTRYQGSIDSCLKELTSVLGEPYAPKALPAAGQ